jgi:hypothetical protein
VPQNAHLHTAGPVVLEIIVPRIVSETFAGWRAAANNVQPAAMALSAVHDAIVTTVHDTVRFTFLAALAIASISALAFTVVSFSYVLAQKSTVSAQLDSMSYCRSA